MADHLSTIMSAIPIATLLSEISLAEIPVAVAIENRGSFL
jgi:hypothetical protein